MEPFLLRGHQGVQEGKGEMLGHSMRYGITRLALGEQPFIEIDEQRYRRICDSKDRVIDVLSIEEKFDLLLENYAELERELLQLNLRQLVFFDLDWRSFRNDSRLVSRRLANFLSSAKLYIDQVQHDTSGLLGAAAVKELRSRFSLSYDSSFSYRLMEALRNSMQHRSIPIKSVSYSSSWHNDREPSVDEYRAGFVLDLELLENDAKFKRPVLAEFRRRGEQANVMGDVRAYVGLLAEVHDWVREMLRPKLQQWEDELRTVIETAKREFPEGRIVGLGVGATAEEGSYTEHEQIFEDLLHYRAFLARKNSTLRLLPQRYVSSLSLPGDKV